MSMEDYFNWYEMGAASLWWYNMENKLYKLDQPPIVSWKEMNKKEFFLSIEYEQTQFTIRCFFLNKYSGQ